jgi:hypothetical protein
MKKKQKQLYQSQTWLVKTPISLCHNTHGDGEILNIAKNYPMIVSENQFDNTAQPPLLSC